MPAGYLQTTRKWPENLGVENISYTAERRQEGRNAEGVCFSRVRGFGERVRGGKERRGIVENKARFVEGGIKEVARVQFSRRK